MEDYEILLSYAEKDNAIANRLATLLQDKGIRVYYDKFKEAEKWGKNSIDFDNDIFGKKGKYCIVLLSINYSNSNLTKLQRQIAQNRAFTQAEEYILPLRLDDTKIDGFLDVIADVKYYEKDESEIIDLICKKLGVKSNSIVTNLISFFYSSPKKEKVKFEMMSTEKYDNPFSTEVQWANQDLMQVVKLKDIKIVGCEVLPHRIQLESSFENYEAIRQLFLSRKLSELTNINWTKIAISNPEDKFRAPKSSPLIISSKYEESKFNTLGATVVCHSYSIEGFIEEEKRAEKILGTGNTMDFKKCKVFITKSDTNLYIHSNYKKLGCDFVTKIATNTEVSLFTLFMNLTCLEYPDDNKINQLADAHKNHVQYFIDETVNDLDVKFFCAATNVEFV